MAQVELEQLVEQLVFLMQRRARNRRVTLCIEPMSTALVITARPLPLQLLLAACIDHELVGATFTNFTKAARNAQVGINGLVAQHRPRERAGNKPSTPGWQEPQVTYTVSVLTVSS